MANHEPSIADLIREAIRDAQDLVRTEIALARAELRDEVSRLGAGAAMLASAAMAALLGLGFLGTTIAWAISALAGWPAWAGFGIVTVLMFGAAVALAVIGRRRMTAARHMPHTVDTVKENLQWIKARTS
jgi:uncharacterized membrane protein YqjE